MIESRSAVARWPDIIDVHVPLTSYARPGGFNDPDMLEAGRSGLTDTEQRSLAMWSMTAAPLVAGHDVHDASAATTSILKNAGLISVDQDPLGLQATQVCFDGTRRVPAKRPANGDVAVALFHQGGRTNTITTTAGAVGRGGNSFTLRDLWTGATSSTTGAISSGVVAHGTAVFRVSGGLTAAPGLASACAARSPERKHATATRRPRGAGHRRWGTTASP